MEEPWVYFRMAVNLFDIHAVAHGLSNIPDALGTGCLQLGEYLFRFGILHILKAIGV